MKDFSSRVPPLYKIAAKYAKEAIENGSSVKRLVYSRKHPNIKALYALVSEILRHFKHLDYLIKKTKLVENNPSISPWLFRVLITELLWGKGKLPSVASKIIQTVLSHKNDFEKHLRKAEKEIAIVEKVIKPKYIRINTLKVSIQEAIQAFKDEGYNYKKYKKEDGYDNFLSVASSLEENDFTSDIHFSELLLFSSKAQFYGHEAYKNGLIILQDKASCIPVHLLNPPPGSTVLDMCAAPGTKTTLIASFLENQGIVYAVDRDKKRFQDLTEFVRNSGASCVETINKDILDLNKIDFPNVEYILVDPSCSGSGMLDRLENSSEIKTDYDRLKKLSGFQIIILKHALRNFPNAKRIVYSTCSLYPEENEEVVKDVLASTTKFKLVSAKNLLKGPWVNFGSPNFGEIGEYCLYAKPEKDLTNGFFVAVFEKLEDGEVNPHCIFNFPKSNGQKDIPKIQENDNKKNLEKKRKNSTDKISLSVSLLKRSKKKRKKNKRKQAPSQNVSNNKNTDLEDCSDKGKEIMTSEDGNEKEKHKKRKYEDSELTNEKIHKVKKKKRMKKNKEDLEKSINHNDSINLNNNNKEKELNFSDGVNDINKKKKQIKENNLREVNDTEDNFAKIIEDLEKSINDHFNKRKQKQDDLSKTNDTHTFAKLIDDTQHKYDVKTNTSEENKESEENLNTKINKKQTNKKTGHEESEIKDKVDDKLSNNKKTKMKRQDLTKEIENCFPEKEKIHSKKKHIFINNDIIQDEANDQRQNKFSNNKSKNQKHDIKDVIELVNKNEISISEGNCKKKKKHYYDDQNIIQDENNEKDNEYNNKNSEKHKHITEVNEISKSNDVNKAEVYLKKKKKYDKQNNIIRDEENGEKNNEFSNKKSQKRKHNIEEDNDTMENNEINKSKENFKKKKKQRDMIQDEENSETKNEFNSKKSKKHEYHVKEVDETSKNNDLNTAEVDFKNKNEYNYDVQNDVIKYEENGEKNDEFGNKKSKKHKHNIKEGNEILKSNEINVSEGNIKKKKKQRDVILNEENNETKNEFSSKKSKKHEHNIQKSNEIVDNREMNISVGNVKRKKKYHHDEQNDIIQDEEYSKKKNEYNNKKLKKT